MNTDRGISLKLCILLLAGLLACGNAAAQGSGQADKKGDKTKTKQAQAVSKDVYERITKAQEAVDAQDYNGALKMLNNLYTIEETLLSAYEQVMTQTKSVAK